MNWKSNTMNENEKKELGAICLFSFLLILGLGLLFFVGLGGKATSTFFPGMSKYVHVLALLPFFYCFPILIIYRFKNYSFLPKLGNKKIDFDKIISIVSLISIIAVTFFIILIAMDFFPNLNEGKLLALSSPLLLSSTLYFVFLIHLNQKNKKSLYAYLLIFVGLFLLPLLLSLILFFAFGKEEGLLLMSLLPMAGFILHYKNK